jgi:hypothetical protein
MTSVSKSKALFAGAAIFCVTISFFSSCKKTTAPAGPMGEQGVSGNGKAGNLEGTIMLYDQYLIKKSDQLATVTVAIEGTAYSTTSNEAGSYTLTNVPPGVYNISFRGKGCGLIQKQQVAFMGNGNLILEQTNIYEKASFYLIGATVFDTSEISGHFSYFLYYPKEENTLYRGHIMLLGRQPNLHIEDPESYEFVIMQGISPFSDYYLYYAKTPYGPGTKFYAKFYPNISVSYGGGYYYDVRLDKRVYTSYNTPLPDVYTITAH